MQKVASLILARDTKIFVAPGEQGFSFFQEKMLIGTVSVLLTSTSWKIRKKKKKNSEKPAACVLLQATI